MSLLPAPGPASRTAAIAFAVYMVLGTVIGETWPLSRYPMYADLTSGGAIPLFLADGKPVFPEELVDIQGCAPEQIRIPDGIQGNVGWRMDEIRRWVASHGSDATGPVRLQVGLTRVVATPDGPQTSDEFLELCAGTARRAP